MGNAEVGNQFKGKENYDRLYRSRYPDKLDLSPDSELHRTLVLEIFSRARESRNFMEKRFNSWNAIDKTLIAYKDLSADDEKTKSKDPNKPTSLVVPISFAIRETILTYYCETFLKPPVFRYRGVEGRDALTAVKMEIITDLQRFRSKAELPLYSMWNDATSYGVGFAAPYWMRRYGAGTPKSPSAGSPRMLWEGNGLTHISPYDALPDPNRSINEIQAGEFFGRVRHTSVVELLAEERNDEQIFNCQYLRQMQRLSVFKPQSVEYDERLVFESQGSQPVDVIELSITIIPKDWGVGTGEYPEKWLFWLAGDALILKAEPLGLFYDEHPIVGCAPLFDNYSMAPVSILERIAGLQLFADWLINAYILGTRRGMAINLLVDPSAVNMEDVRSDEMVKIIRLNKSHWGRGKVTDYISQLKIDNVTSENIPGVSFIMDLVQRVTGVNDIMQGIMRTGGERRSATEARDSLSNAMNRVKKSAKIISIQTHQDIARIWAYNNQQNLSREQRVAITGDWQRRLEEEYGMTADQVPGGELTIAPDDFVDFDYNLISSDASSIGDENVDAWTQLVSPMFANPQAGQMMGLDMKRIFLHVARQLGATDVSDFLIKPPKVRTMPDKQVAREAERGNLEPINPPKDEFGLR